MNDKEPKVYKRSEVGIFPLDDPKREKERITKVNKEAYSRMKDAAYFQCVGGRDGTDKWEDPK